MNICLELAWCDFGAGTVDPRGGGPAREILVTGGPPKPAKIGVKMCSKMPVEIHAETDVKTL